MCQLCCLYPPRSHSKQRLAVKSVQSYSRSGMSLCMHTHTQTALSAVRRKMSRWVYPWLLYASLPFSDRYWATAETWFHLLSVSCGCYLHLFRAVTGCSQLSVQQQWGIWREQQRCQQKMAGTDSSHWGFNELPVSSLPHRGKMKNCGSLGSGYICLCNSVPLSTARAVEPVTCIPAAYSDSHYCKLWRFPHLTTKCPYSLSGHIHLFTTAGPIVTLEHYRKQSAFIFGAMLLHLERF